MQIKVRPCELSLIMQTKQSICWNLRGCKRQTKKNTRDMNIGIMHASASKAGGGRRTSARGAPEMSPIYVTHSNGWCAAGRRYVSEPANRDTTRAFRHHKDGGGIVIPSSAWSIGGADDASGLFRVSCGCNMISSLGLMLFRRCRLHIIRRHEGQVVACTGERVVLGVIWAE